MRWQDNFHRGFGMKRWRHAESQHVAREFFPQHNPSAAVAVVDCLQEQLGVNFDQLHTETDLATDPGMDEVLEMFEIAMALSEAHPLQLTGEYVCEARTVGKLVELVTELLSQNSRKT